MYGGFRLAYIITMLLVNPNGQLIGVSESKVSWLLAHGFKKAPEMQSPEKPVTENKLLDSFKNDGLPVRFLTSVDKPDGYGQSQSYLTMALIKNGIWPDKKDTGQEIGLCYYTPVFADRLTSPIKVVYTMFESSTIPEAWVKHLRKVDKVLVPSKFCQEIFATRGIESTVVPLGYNHEVYKYLDRPSHPVFTFLHYNAFNTRKGFDLVFKAFTEEFKTNEPVKMVFKTINPRLPFPIIKSEYPNIEVIKGEFTYPQMTELLRSADAFVFPSRGEGFGLTPLECLATGMSVLIPNSSGMSEYFDDKYFYEIKVKGTCPAVYANYVPSDVGVMSEPDLDSLKKQMRYVFEHQDEAKEKAKAGASWVRYNWTIDQTAKKLSEELKQIKKKIIPTNAPDLAFLTEDINFYSGGRYHSWMQAVMLTESRLKVTVFTNEMPCFADDFDLYERPNVKIIGHDPEDPDHRGAKAFDTLDIEAGAYFGTPAKASLAALRLGLKYKKPVYVTMFDPPSWVESSDVTHHDELERDFQLKAFLDAHLSELVDFKLIVLTENAIDDYAKWYGLDKKYIYAIHPAINSRIVELFDKSVTRKRHNSIVTCSRNHPRKGFSDVLHAFKPFSRDHDLHIITQSEDGIITKATEMGIPIDKIFIHTKISDVDKFKLMAQSKVLLSGSKFEGFGMWATEARAMGMPVVCYDLPALKDVYNDEGMYKATSFDPNDLREKLGNALGSEPIKPMTDHYFEVLQSKLLELVAPKSHADPLLEVTPMFIVLNEEKFVEASLRAVLKRKEVQQVIIVEGADTRYPNASKKGLSVDKTSKIIKKLIKEFPDRIIYEQMGWVNGKEALRNRCMRLSKQEGWGLFVDGDEVWSDDNWKKLIKTMQENKESGVIYFKHLHFWKQPDLVAVGSQWDKHLFRCFRFAEKGMYLKQHAGEPRTVSGERLGEKYGKVIDDRIKIHHYGAMKDGADIKDKLEFYKRRDKGLVVKDTWTNWKAGKETQWTNAGGTAEKYTGTHPKEVRDIICKN
jgi:glycosyltransferase involved in cell wall biosynthesis